MPSIEFIFQGVNPVTHAQKIKTLLTLPNSELQIFSVAYLRSSSIASLYPEISHLPNPNNLHCFIGIRNGVTSIQGLTALFNLGVHLYVIDTASASIIYHPKVYLSKNNTTANVIVGSANLTNSGLQRNVEASTFITLNLANPDDATFLQTVIDPILNMPTQFPDHVIAINSIDDLIRLLAEGRISDERIPRVSMPSTRSEEVRTELPPIPIPMNPIIVPPIIPAPIALPPTAMPLWLLQWESSPLKERALNIPSGINSHVTGSITLTKGTYTHIDQRHYFYDVVFSGLTWILRGNLLHANANFYLQICGILHGPYNLEITHNPDTTSRTYLQNNAMTHLKWGAVKPLIANHGLLNRTLKLYQNSLNPIEYLITID